MGTLLAQVKHKFVQEQGQGLAEYTFVTLLVAIPVAGSVVYCGNAVVQLYSTIVALFPGS
ncbi:MAG: hypothetical protein R3E79_13715 [Caldilineaceae bacterium]